MKFEINFDDSRAKKFKYSEENTFLKKNMKLLEQKQGGFFKFGLSERIENDKQEKIFKILENIYKKNKDYAFYRINKKPLNSDLLNLIADPSMLMVSYARLVGNMKPFLKTSDDMNIDLFLIIKKLIKTSKYPWGSNKKIYLYKSVNGGIQRFLVIPPIVDKVVQESLVTVLMAIYEPYFEYMNCSFGLRPNTGVHDAIVSLVNRKNNELSIVLTGATNVLPNGINAKMFIETLEKNIHDRKLIKFIEKRLDCCSYDMEWERRNWVKQSGVDLLYMWNIYLLKFDAFLLSRVGELFSFYNEKVKGDLSLGCNMVTLENKKMYKKALTLKKIIIWLNRSMHEDRELEQVKEFLNKGPIVLKRMGEFSGELYKFIDLIEYIGFRTLKSLRLIIRNGEELFNAFERRIDISCDFNLYRSKLNYAYVRYANDWILLTNAKKYILEKIKRMLYGFFTEVSSSNLVMDQILLLNIKEKPLLFLGYELWSCDNKRELCKYKMRQSNKLDLSLEGSRLFAKVDKQRLLNRLYLQGYCTNKGFPREISSLIHLEDFLIIERFNLILLRISLYFAEFIENPERSLSQFIYIIRYSCLKTIAQKHKLSLRKVFVKYGSVLEKNARSRERTIEFKLVKKVGRNMCSRTCKLLTTKEVIEQAKSLKQRERVLQNSLQRDEDKFYWHVL